MVGRIRLGQGRELARHFGPVKVAAFHDHTAEGGAVAADELGCGFDHDISAGLQRAEQVRGGEGVVDDHRQMMLVGDGGDGFEVRQVGVRIAEGLEVDELGVLLDGVLELLRILGGDEGGGDAVTRQGVTQQVEGATVDVLGCDDVIAGLGDVAHRVFDRGCAGCDGQTCGAAFEGCDAVFEHALSGVGQAAVDVAWVRQPETGLGVVEIMEHVAGGLVDRHRAGIGCRIGLLLADVKLHGFCSLWGSGSLLVLLTTRLAVCGGWSGVGSDNNPTSLRNANRALSHLPISPYKPLQSLPSRLCKTTLVAIKKLATRQQTASW